MRKILLGTTAVVGAALIGATTAQAQTAPTVRVGGFMFGMYNNISDDFDRGRVAIGQSAAGTPVAQGTGVAGAGQVGRSRNDFRHELEVHVFVTGKMANGLSYGGVIEIQNDGTGAGAGTGLDLDEAYVFVSSPTLGTIRFGEEDNAASIMQVRAPSITGFGSDGDWDDGVISSAAATGTGPSLLTGINDGNDATKIVYLSPQFFGFDFGASYAPNQGEGERAFLGRSVDNVNLTVDGGLQPLQRDRTTLGNELALAARYRGSFGNIGVTGGFGFQRSDGPQATAAGARAFNRDVSAYTVGLQLTGFGFTVGGEYTWGNYSGISAGRAPLARNPDGSNRDASNHWVLGVTYTMGAVAVGGFYGVANQDNGTIGTGTVASPVLTFRDREQTVWGLGAVYTLAPGFELLASYNQLKDENIRIGNATFDRDVNVFFTGARLAF